jgi:polyisoprenoid-binding protein YceI
MTTTTATTPEVAAATGTWELDVPHTRFAFAAKHAMVSTVHGQFGIFDGELVLDGENPENSSVSINIDAASIDTGTTQRDDHLRSADFLDVENYPKLTFVSTGIRYEGGNDFAITGDLTIRGTTRSVEFPVELQGTTTDPYGTQKIGFEGSTTISRKDFGLTWNVALEAGGFMVGDKIKIALDVEANKKA